MHYIRPSFRAGQIRFFSQGASFTCSAPQPLLEVHPDNESRIMACAALVAGSRPTPTPDVTAEGWPEKPGRGPPTAHES
jgi:hypothetical protein